MKYTKTVRASRNVGPARPIRASRSALRRRAVKADDEIEDIDAPIDDAPIDDAPIDDVAEVTVDDAATELLFEAEDVAELVSEVAGLPVDVTVDEDEVTFTVGEDTYTVTPEGDEEIVEQSRRVSKSASSVRAGRQIRRPVRRVAASRRAARRVSASRRVAAARRVSASRRVRK